MLKTMLRKALNIFISILLLLPLFTGGVGFFQAANKYSTSFQKPCDMNDCNPSMPKCPLCPSSSPTNLYFQHEAGAYLPVLASSFIEDSVSTLSDQGVIKGIFRPPIATS
jgi:hypothetical protein